MSVETSDQYLLHSNRQKQLDKSSEYIHSFLSRYSDACNYKVNSCPTCGNTNSNDLFRKNSGLYAYCQSCEHVFLKTSLKPELLLEFYTNYPTSSLDWHVNENDFYQRIYASGLEMISSISDQNKILDIGCSSGFFLSIAKDKGFISSGIEPNYLESSYAKNAGINIIGSTINDIPKTQIFDVITMWDVLEHIDSPINYLKQLTRLLTPGGIVFVQVPTCDSLAARILRSECNMFDGIEHLTLFSSLSLDKAFTEAGFTLASKKTVISEQFAISNYLNYEQDPYHPVQKSKESYLRDVVDFNQIEKHSLGYKIQACYSYLG